MAHQQHTAAPHSTVVTSAETKDALAQEVFEVLMRARQAGVDLGWPSMNRLNQFRVGMFSNDLPGNPLQSDVCLTIGETLWFT